MKITGIKPIKDYILVLPDDVKEKTASGLYIPESAKETPQRGTVIAVGDGTKDESMEIRANFTVLYRKYAGTEVSFNSKDYLLMKQSDIYAILETEKID